jgi:hypothetical protein
MPCFTRVIACLLGILFWEALETLVWDSLILLCKSIGALQYIRRRAFLCSRHNLTFTNQLTPAFELSLD